MNRRRLCDECDGRGLLWLVQRTPGPDVAAPAEPLLCAGCDGRGWVAVAPVRPKVQPLAVPG